MAIGIKEIEEALTEKGGNISATARSLGVSRKTVYNKINKHKTLKDLQKDLKESRIDDAEDALGNAVKKGEAWAVCFILKTLGKGRGYVERTELTGEDGKAIETVSNIVIQGVESDGS